MRKLLSFALLLVFSYSMSSAALTPPIIYKSPTPIVLPLLLNDARISIEGQSYDLDFLNDRITERYVLKSNEQSAQLAQVALFQYAHPGGIKFNPDQILIDGVSQPAASYRVANVLDNDFSYDGNIRVLEEKNIEPLIKQIVDEGNYRMKTFNEDAPVTRYEITLLASEQSRFILSIHFNPAITKLLINAPTASYKTRQYDNIPFELYDELNAGESRTYILYACGKGSLTHSLKQFTVEGFLPMEKANISLSQTIQQNLSFDEILRDAEQGITLPDIFVGIGTLNFAKMYVDREFALDNIVVKYDELSNAADAPYLFASVFELSFAPDQTREVVINRPLGYGFDDASRTKYLECFTVLYTDPLYSWYSLDSAQFTFIYKDGLKGFSGNTVLNDRVYDNMFSRQASSYVNYYIGIYYISKRPGNFPIVAFVIITVLAGVVIVIVSRRKKRQ